MNTRGRVATRLRAMGLLCLVGTLLTAGPARAAGGAEEAAQSVAESWLKLVDGGQYEKSWQEAAKLFKGAITVEQWKQAVGGVRGPLGKVVSRKIKSRQYMEQVPGAPDGKYVVLQFETVFENKASAIETVTPMVDPDGAWRVSGYFVK
jgi:hypothetical protein